MPPVHDSAVASRQPRAPSTGRARAPPPAARPRRTGSRPAAPRMPAARASAACRAASGSARMSISISKLRAQMLVSTPGGSPPAACEQVGHVRLADAVGARAAGAARRRPPEQLGQAGCSGASCHSRRSSDGTPGRITSRAPPDCASPEPARCRRCPSTRRAAQDMRLLAVAGRETVAREAAASGHRVRPLVICASTASSSTSVTPATSADRLHGAVVVGGPEPARRDHQVDFAAASRRPSPISSRPSPTISVRRIAKAMPLQAARQESWRFVGDHAAQELVARQQDGGCRTLHAVGDGVVGDADDRARIGAGGQPHGPPIDGDRQAPRRPDVCEHDRLSRPDRDRRLQVVAVPPAAFPGWSPPAVRSQKGGAPEASTRSR